jgi:hypothetical protein
MVWRQAGVLADSPGREADEPRGGRLAGEAREPAVAGTLARRVAIVGGVKLWLPGTLADSRTLQNV